MYIEQTRRWIHSFVIQQNLCPFAKNEMDKNSIVFTLSQAQSHDAAMQDLRQEIQRLNAQPEIESTFLIVPQFLQDFFDYLEFSDQAENIMIDEGFEGIYQLATFHPDYCFADASYDDVTNYTNRSPYPMFQLLRSASLRNAMQSFGNTGAIPKRNMNLLRHLGIDAVEQLLNASLIPQESVE